MIERLIAAFVSGGISGGVTLLLGSNLHTAAVVFGISWLLTFLLGGVFLLIEWMDS